MMPAGQVLTMLADGAEQLALARYRLRRLLELAVDHNDDALQQLVMREAEASAIEYVRVVTAAAAAARSPE